MRLQTPSEIHHAGQRAKCAAECAAYYAMVPRHCIQRVQAKTYKKHEAANKQQLLCGAVHLGMTHSCILQLYG